MGDNWELGRDGDLCWHISEDLKRFRQLTMGGAVIMGRATWDSLPKKPLPGRLNIVLTSRPSLDGAPEGVLTANSLDEAVALAGKKEVFIIGGESVYRQAFPIADRLEITHIYEEDPDADKFFPEFTPDDWKLVDKSELMETEDGITFGYESYIRRKEE